MKDRKLEYFLHQLPEKEWTEFRNELHKSQLPRDQTLLKLMELLTHESYEDEKLYHALYQDKSFSEKQLRNLRSTLFTRLMDFLAVNEFRNSHQYDGFLLKALNRIQAHRYFPQIRKKVDKDIRKLPLSIDVLDGIAMQQVEETSHQLLTQGRKMAGYTASIQRKEEAFVGGLLQRKMGGLAYERMSGKPSEEKSQFLWNAILDSLEAGAYADSVLIQTYFLLYKAASDPDNQTHYENAKNQLTLFGGEIAKKELIQLYTVTLNRCIHGINRGDRVYLQETLNTYQEILDRELFSGEEGIAHFHYKAIVSIAIRLRRLEWVANFMDSYSHLLQEPHRENTHAYGQGLLAFHLGEFERSEQLMNQVLKDFEDPFLGLDARAYLLRIYYETGNVTSMDALCTSFRLFLRRHTQISKERRQNYKEFVRFSGDS